MLRCGSALRFGQPLGRNYCVSKNKWELISPAIADKTGLSLLQDPLLNKGIGFASVERDRLDLRGLLPPRLASFEEQMERFLDNYDSLETDMDRHNVLMELMDRNETLFFRVVLENITRMAPMIYTPIVGWACLNFGKIFRRPRGMYFSLNDVGHMHAMMHNWPASKVDVIVVTDGSRILGLGDLGAHGMGIPIGKLALYVAGAGVNPANVLPIQLDVGCDNEELRNDKYYLGLPVPRVPDSEYYDIVDEMMAAIRNRYPHALIQFEDFRSDRALPILDRYREKYCCFNDDIQGTGAVAAAGVMSALRTQGKPIEDLVSQKIVCAGAGSAGIGVCMGILRSMEALGVPRAEALKNFYVLDADGLLINDGSKKFAFGQELFARDDITQPMSLVETVKHVKPEVLLGVTGVAGIFTEEVVREMASGVEQPILFPMSNPTSKAECTAEQAFTWSDGRAIVGSGSPFDPVSLNGKTLHASQANNMYIFPGLGLGVVASGAVKISDTMIHAASAALVDCMNDHPVELEQGKLFPNLEKIRQVSLHVATAVAEQAFREDVASVEHPFGISIKDWIHEQMWDPTYVPIVPPHTNMHKVGVRTELRRALRTDRSTADWK